MTTYMVLLAEKLPAGVLGPAFPDYDSPPYGNLLNCGAEDFRRVRHDLGGGALRLKFVSLTCTEDELLCWKLAQAETRVVAIWGDIPLSHLAMTGLLVTRYFLPNLVNWRTTKPSPTLSSYPGRSDTPEYLTLMEQAITDAATLIAPYQHESREAYGKEYNQVLAAQGVSVAIRIEPRPWWDFLPRDNWQYLEPFAIK